MEKDIGKINKNETTDIVLRVDDFADRKGLTIREFVTSERYTGFTKAGVRILASDFPKFKEMINSISDEDMKEEVPSEEAELEPGQETLEQATEIKPEEVPKPPEPEIETEKPGEEKPKGDLPDY